MRVNFLHRLAFLMIDISMSVDPPGTLAFLKREPKLYRIYRYFNRWQLLITSINGGNQR